MAVQRMQPRIAFNLSEDFDAGPREERDEAKKRQHHDHEDGIHRSHRHDTKGRKYGERGFCLVDAIDQAHGRDIDERQTSHDEHRSEGRRGHVLQRLRQKHEHGCDCNGCDQSDSTRSPARCIAHGRPRVCAADCETLRERRHDVRDAEGREILIRIQFISVLGCETARRQHETREGDQGQTSGMRKKSQGALPVPRAGP